MQIFVTSILPLAGIYPADNSIVFMDNAPVHAKEWVRQECQRVGVMVIFLPPYGYELNPAELVFNVGRARMQRNYGLVNIQHPLMNGRRIGEVFAECCFECVSPTIACNFYIHCGIPVTDAERQWAVNQ